VPKSANFDSREGGKGGRVGEKKKPRLRFFSMGIAAARKRKEGEGRKRRYLCC